ncbi:hypothetical protein H5T51_08990 [Candidatus Bathyarchaeota archaeon]|nr:hypothetical protein [Candidatus Bathyarchaeota archaeon]
MRILREIKELFRIMKHRRPTRIYCPRCGSPEVGLSSSLDYWLTPKKYVCRKCGYMGPIIMELEEIEKEE